VQQGTSAEPLRLPRLVRIVTDALLIPFEYRNKTVCASQLEKHPRESSKLSGQRKYIDEFESKSKRMNQTGPRFGQLANFIQITECSSMKH